MRHIFCLLNRRPGTGPARLPRCRWSNGIQVLIAILVLSYSTIMANPGPFDGNDILSGATRQSLLADSLVLRYIDINASRFPRIVSHVTVSDEIGFTVCNLNEANFVVYEDGVRELPIEVVELGDDAIDVNVVLAIDRSGSMKQELMDAKAAANTFVQLMQKNDKSAVVSFSHEITTEYPLSNNKDSLAAAIARVNYKGDTAILDAILHSANLLKEVPSGRVIILMTDGTDNSSQNTLAQVIQMVKSLKIRVFTIGLGLKRGGGAEDTLKTISLATGSGYYYSPTSADLAHIYQEISGLLHHQYQVTYVTHNSAKDSTLRQVQIGVHRFQHTGSDTASYRAPYEPPPPVIEVYPNPFTPNGDGFNDLVEFIYDNGRPINWQIHIMATDGRVLKRLPEGSSRWDGTDEAGNLLRPGGYLYLISQNDQILRRGMLHLIR